jgi:HTH-type transcriptional regulator/antitoxin HipB
VDTGYIAYIRLANRITMRVNVTVPSQIGEIVRARRKAHKLSQADLAATLGISQSRLSAMEQNPENLPLSRLITVCNVLGLDLVLQDKTGQVAKTPKPAW